MLDGAALAAAAAVAAVAEVEQGRLVVVSPQGTRGSPHDPDRLDGVVPTEDGIELSVGDGHARYRLVAPSLLAADRRHARLATTRLTMTVTPYGSGSVVRTWHFDDAELLLTWDPAVAAGQARTRGTSRPVEDPA